MPRPRSGTERVTSSREAQLRWRWSASAWPRSSRRKVAPRIGPGLCSRGAATPRALRNRQDRLRATSLDLSCRAPSRFLPPSVCAAREWSEGFGSWGKRSARGRRRRSPPLGLRPVLTLQRTNREPPHPVPGVLHSHDDSLEQITGALRDDLNRAGCYGSRSLVAEPERDHAGHRASALG